MRVSRSRKIRLRFHVRSVLNDETYVCCESLGNSPLTTCMLLQLLCEIRSKIVSILFYSKTKPYICVVVVVVIIIIIITISSSINSIITAATCSQNAINAVSSVRSAMDSPLFFCPFIPLNTPLQCAEAERRRPLLLHHLLHLRQIRAN